MSSFAQTYFQSGNNIPLWEFPEHQAEVGVDQVVDLLGAVDSRDVTQIRVCRRVEADEPRDDATLPGQHLRSSAAAGRLCGRCKTDSVISTVWRSSLYLVSVLKFNHCYFLIF